MTDLDKPSERGRGPDPRSIGLLDVISLLDLRSIAYSGGCLTKLLILI